MKTLPKLEEKLKTLPINLNQKSSHEANKVCIEHDAIWGFLVSNLFHLC